MSENRQRKKSSTSAAKRPKRKKGGNIGAVLATLGIAFVVLLSGIVYLSWEEPSEEQKIVEVKEKVKEKSEKPKKSERPEKSQRPLKHKKPEQPESPKPERVERPENATNEKPERFEQPVTERPEKTRPEKTEAQVHALVKPPALSVSKPKISIIIDDIGNSEHLDNEIISIKAPITVSVFPLLSDSKAIAEKAISDGKEVMLHLPMEPHDYPQVDPGKGALFTDMDDIAIITQLFEDINSVPGIKGVNNHMGSKFTEDKTRMRIVLNQFKERGLYFVDSKTSPRSKSDKIAKKLGVKAGARDVFLDNEQDERYILNRIEELKGIARASGSAIGIGHPYPATIAALKKALPRIKEEFEIVPASVLVK